MKGWEIPEWPYWCFLPIAYWMILFMGKQRRQCTREVWLEMKKFQVLVTG
ncbi:MAG: hypothetical protein RR686_18515 [Morganella sp. (in: enterobacteria)]|nr:hypothetical protein [Citrobacter freundii]WFW61090.1 hypothetical protein NFJ76_03630 [Citrobacter freundii]